MTEINTVYTPVWGHWLGEEDGRQVQICKATDYHYGRYTTYGSAIPEWNNQSTNLRLSGCPISSQENGTHGALRIASVG